MKHTNITCTACGCLCDDLTLTVEANQLVQFEPHCPLAEDWFQKQLNAEPDTVQIQGKVAEYAQAIEQATEILGHSKAPLLFGLSRSSTPGQRAAIELADHLGGYVDTTASLCHAPSIMAIQQVGEQTCSLGEVKNRADLVVFWGVDPLQSHPRHTERYSVDPIGEFIPNGRKDRTVIVIDETQNRTADIADHFLQIDSDLNFNVLWALRQLISGKPLNWNEDSGVSLASLKELAQQLTSCKMGVIFFGLGVSQSRLGHLTVEALLELVTDLNEQTRFYARRMRLPGDVTGADSVLCWQTGFPFAVNLQRGYPRYEPQEYSAQSLLENQEVDACLLIGSESVEKFSAKAQKHLNAIPTVVLEYPGHESQLAPTVKFTTGVYGLHYKGTAYRMDEVPLPLRPVLTTNFPADHTVLDDLLKNLQAK